MRQFLRSLAGCRGRRRAACGAGSRQGAGLEAAPRLLSSYRRGSKRSRGISRLHGCNLTPTQSPALLVEDALLDFRLLRKRCTARGESRGAQWSPMLSLPTCLTSGWKSSKEPFPLCEGSAITNTAEAAFHRRICRIRWPCFILSPFLL